MRAIQMLRRVRVEGKMNQNTLEKIQAIASIVSAVAIPLAIALVGWLVQSSLQSEDIKKDYVQMALGIFQSEEQKIMTICVAGLLRF